MNSNFNRQFVLIDFELLDDARFIRFVNTAEFGTYLILRRYIWRGGEKKPHFLGLHELYEEEKLLVCSVRNQKIADKLGLNDVTRVSKHISKLEEAGVIRRIRTGRQNIYVLGEWFDYAPSRMARSAWSGSIWSRNSGSPDLTWPKKPSLIWRRMQVRVGGKGQTLIEKRIEKTIPLTVSNP